MKPLIIDEPYPSLDGIEENRRSAAVISGLYAGRHGELNAVLQYVYQSFYFFKNGEEETAGLLIGIALAEMEHLEILGKLLLVLGRSPEYSAWNGFFNEYYSARNVVYATESFKMLLDDISAEMLAVKDYREAAKTVGEGKVADVLNRIRLDEELHIRKLEEVIREKKK